MVIAGSNPASASAGNVLAVVAPASFASLETELVRLGYRATAMENPYDAFVELLDRPLVYRALVVSLPALYREELTIIKSVRARLPHLDVLLAHTDGRHAALAEAMRLGATGLLSDEAVHRLADVEPAAEQAESDTGIPAAPTTNANNDEPAAEVERPEEPDERADIEPLLTADELRALLQEQPTLPPP